MIRNRLRFNFDASKELDSGVTLGGRIRLQYDEDTGSAAGSELSAASIYAEASGFRVEVGTSNTAFDSLALLYNAEIGYVGKSNAMTFATGTDGSFGADGANFGIFASYAVGDLSARLAYCTSDGEGSAVGSGYDCGKTASVGFDSNTLHPGAFISVPDDLLGDDISSGIGFTYDLGGATIAGTIQKGFNDQTNAVLGINFSF